MINQQMKLDSKTGEVFPSQRIVSPNFNQRPSGTNISLIVLHNISLPPGIFGESEITALFTNTLCVAKRPELKDVEGLKVSAHFLIRRDGALIQFVSTQDRAWHAGVSQWQGRSGCNDFSIGIEFEGSDFVPFEAAQYDIGVALIQLLCQHYPIQACVGHSDVAPGRKTDPGPYFDWKHLAQNLSETALVLDPVSCTLIAQK